MNNMIYIIILCIIIQVKTQHTSEAIDDITNYEENKKLNVQASEAIEDENYDDMEKLNQQASEAVEDEKYDDGDKDYIANMELSDDNKENLETQDEEMEKAREAGDAADLFGTNQHYNIPVNYQDFGRRFVLTYPYVEKNILNDAAEAELDKTVKQYLEFQKTQIKELTPIKAPPEFVLRIAKQSALLEASKPKNPSDEVVQKDILRTGEYWNDVWKEEVDVKKMMLRIRNNQNKLDSVTVTISPGSRLHKLISMLKKKSPRFLYVINKNTERYFLF